MEQIFDMLNLTVPVLILAVFTLHYQLRKKVEIRIETELAKQRILAYEALHLAFCRVMRTKTPLVRQQQEIEQIMAYYGFPDLGTDYPEALSEQKTFDAFFQELQDAVTNNSVLLDYDTMKQAQRSMSVLSRIKAMLDAFCDAENTYRKGDTEPKNVRKKIDYAYLLAGIMLKTHFNKSFLAMEDTLSHQISNIEVVPSRRYLKKLLWPSVGHSRKIFITHIRQFHQLLAYVDVSDRYTFQQYLNLPEKQRSEFFIDYRSRMEMQLHTCFI